MPFPHVASRCKSPNVSRVGPVHDVSYPDFSVLDDHLAQLACYDGQGCERDVARHVYLFLATVRLVSP